MSQNEYLKDQVVLITGCSSGIGRALAFAFRKRGHRTFATARSPEAVQQLQNEGFEALQLDVTRTDSIEQAVGTVIQRAKRIDILVNNAGFNLFGPLAEVPIQGVRSLFETNVVGALEVAQKVFVHMAKQGRGRIVNIGSVVGIVPTPYGGPYCASKAALHMISKVLRMEGEPFGIEVVVVQPGGVRSNLSVTGSIGLERYNCDSSLYQPVYEQIRKRANMSQKDAMDTDEFAEKTLDEVLKKNAPREVRLGTGADFLIELSKVPGSDLDRAMIQNFGLDTLRKKPTS
jgi:NAD(P)-dependent dehydrogenase (short-subunit alcohol dehydrogenase family)